MCLKPQTSPMSSHLPQSRVKPVCKPLNPQAEPFTIASPATQPNSSDLILPHQIYYCEMAQPVMVTHALTLPESPPLQQVGYPLVYGSDQAVFPHFESRNWYLRLAHYAYQASRLGFYTPKLQIQPQPHPESIDVQSNQLGIEGVHVSDNGEKPEMVIIRRMVSAERGRQSRHKFSVTPFPATMEEAQSTGTTTVMIKNIPNQFQFKNLLWILDNHCCELNQATADPALWSMYDFVYLPMDYRRHAFQHRPTNLGYAFVNFTTAGAAFKFYQRFDGLVWNVTENRKECQVTSAQFQGKVALMQNFKGKIFRCRCPKFRPVEYSPARDGFNRRIRGTSVGIYVRGLPQKSLGRCVSCVPA